MVVNKFWILFISFFCLILIFPLIVVWPIDLLFSSLMDKNYVDAWTLGIMAWYLSVLILICIFLIKIIYIGYKFYTQPFKKRKTSPVTK